MFANNVLKSYGHFELLFDLDIVLSEITSQGCISLWDTNWLPTQMVVDYFQRIRFLGKPMRPKDWECMVEQNGANENK